MKVNASATLLVYHGDHLGHLVRKYAIVIGFYNISEKHAVVYDFHII